MATVKDIAKLANVSTATVSRALAEPEKVATATRLKVEQAVAQLSYSPNAMARSLRKKESKTIVVVLPDIGNHFFSEIIKGVEDIAHKKGYNVLVGDFNHELSKAKKFFDLVFSKQADGMLSLTSEIPQSLFLDQNGLSKLPMVMACEYYPGMPVPTVHIDNEYSAAMAIENLVHLGHRKIASITGPMSNPLCQARLQGYKNTMEKAGYPIPGNYIVEGDFSLSSGYSVGRQLLSLNDCPTAVFCHSDEMAIGVLKLARELNIDVPRKMSVVGFDNTAYSEYCMPELTTIHQPRRLIGETAMKLLLDILAGKKPNPELTLPTQLIVRGSTGAPPPA